MFCFLTKVESFSEDLKCQILCPKMLSSKYDNLIRLQFLIFCFMEGAESFFDSTVSRRSHKVGRLQVSFAIEKKLDRFVEESFLYLMCAIAKLFVERGGHLAIKASRTWCNRELHDKPSRHQSIISQM